MRNFWLCLMVWSAVISGCLSSERASGQTRIVQAGATAKAKGAGAPARATIVGNVIIVPAGEHVLTTTWFLPSNTIVQCDPKSKILAAKGSFKKTGFNNPTDPTDASLVAIVEGSNIQVLGCNLEMRKADYGVYKFNPDGTIDETPNDHGYVASEHRHTLTIEGGNNILVEGGSYNASGGDGIYVGARFVFAEGYPQQRKRIPCKDIVIRGVTCDNNLRQGISVTGVDGLLIEGSMLSNTKGASPQAGLDIEPEWYCPASNIVIRNVHSKANKGSAYLVNLDRVDNTTPGAVGIKFNSCTWSELAKNDVPLRLVRVTEPNGFMVSTLPKGSRIEWTGGSLSMTQE